MVWAERAEKGMAGGDFANGWDGSATVEPEIGIWKRLCGVSGHVLHGMWSQEGAPSRSPPCGGDVRQDRGG